MGLASPSSTRLVVTNVSGKILSLFHRYKTPLYEQLYEAAFIPSGSGHGRAIASNIGYYGRCLLILVAVTVISLDLALTWTDTDLYLSSTIQFDTAR
ncbi:hypothetical protein C8J56DRAFT_1053697 [Mycena floridula]|nr:hypothetical protein C8J56DRAFT_1053697 [Mycena floridula]